MPYARDDKKLDAVVSLRPNVERKDIVSILSFHFMLSHIYIYNGAPLHPDKPC
jgi:hypothetical protein